MHLQTLKLSRWVKFNSFKRFFLQSPRLIQNYHTSQDDNRPLPKLLFIQNPIIWFFNKLDLLALKTWDKNFNQKEFERGSRQAVSVITSYITNNDFDKLTGLMSQPAISDLQNEVANRWSQNKRKNIFIDPNDIKFSKPRKLHYTKMFERKFCDIDMTFISLKWAPFPNPPNTLLLIEILARFNREFSDGVPPEWTVTAFKVARFNLMKMVPPR